MRLTSVQVERTLNQFEAEAIPDDHPLADKLKRLFGDHTYFVDSRGLNIVEPIEPDAKGTKAGKVVNLANWGESNPNSLEPHEPEPTDVVVALDMTH